MTLRFLLNANSWFKATCPGASFRNGNEALQDALKACELSRWTEASYIDTLAAAYAETGNFEQAIKYESQVIGMLAASARASQKAKERLNLFRAHKPYRREPKLG